MRSSGVPELAIVHDRDEFRIFGRHSDSAVCAIGQDQSAHRQWLRAIAADEGESVGVNGRVP